jgi:hypothetical protein
MQSFEAHQRETAAILGYGADVDAMNRDHDPLHVALCDWLGFESLSLREAAGETLPADDHLLAVIEESAAIAVQKLMRMRGASVPGVRP